MNEREQMIVLGDDGQQVRPHQMRNAVRREWTQLLKDYGRDGLSKEQMARFRLLDDWQVRHGELDELTVLD